LPCAGFGWHRAFAAHGIITTMKALPPLGSLRRNLITQVTNVRESRFFHDRISVGLLVAAFVVGAFNIVLLAPHISSMRTAVIPVRYSSLGGFDGLGSWYSPLLIALFSVSISAVNGVLAFQAFSRSRLASFFLLVGSVVVALFCLIISNAFAVVGQ